MNDRTTKLLLLLIAFGLFANAGTLFYLAAVPNAQAADSRAYIEGGRLEVKLTEPISVRLDQPVEIRAGNYGTAFPIAVQSPLKIEGAGINSQPLNVRVQQGR